MQQKMTIIYVSYGYGAGDIMMSLFGMDSPSAMIVPLAKRRPEYTFRAVICTHCDSVPGLFEDNPYFSNVTYHVWTGGFDLTREEARDGHPYLHEILDGDGPKERMPFFLSAEQQRLFDVATRIPYVALHLFAGGKDRSWLETIGEEAAFLVMETIVKAGWPVVLLGGSSARREGDTVSHLDESLQWIAGDLGVKNLLGVGGLKLHAALAVNAAVVFGGMSCFVSLATKFSKPMFVMAPQYQKPLFEICGHGAFSGVEGVCQSECELIADVGHLGTVRFLEETPLDVQLWEIEKFLTGLKKK